MLIISHKFALLDFETTGPESSDRIIQVGLALIENGSITRTYASFVQPEIPIPESISKLTGIHEEDVADAPSLDEVVAQLLPLLEDAVLVAHNALFDLGFLQRALTECGYDPFSGRVLDTLEFLRFLFPGLPSLSLGKACRSLGIQLDHHHRADCDAEATAQLWLLCLDRLYEVSLHTLRRLCNIFSASPAYDDVVWLLTEVCTDRELKDEAVLETDRDYRHFRMGVGDWTEEEGRTEPLDPDITAGDFSGFYSQFKPLLQHKFEQYEEREAQEQMIYEVYDAFQSSKHLMVEAGTGTGKSLGYLIPALYYSIVHEDKVVVSTHTINLQEQIRSRDIPLLQELFPMPIHAAVLKGRNHYLCLRKFEHKVNALDFEHPKEDPLTAAQMVTWLEETNHGEDEELQFGNKGVDFWRGVESDTDSCLNRACPWFKRCFYHRARHEANQADIVITNHSLLFTDVKADNRLLPSYNHLVIDEAHQFDETAAKHLGTEVGYFGVVKALQRIYKDSYNGLLPQLIFQLQQADGEDRWQESIQELESSIPELIAAKEDWDRLTENVFTMLAEQSDSNGAQDGQYVLRLREDIWPSGWEDIRSLEQQWFVRISSAIKTYERCIQKLKDDQDDQHIQSLFTDLSGAVKDLSRFKDAVRFITLAKEEEFVFWLEASSIYKSRSVQFNAVPIDVSAMLHEHFFEHKDSVVLTSATLSVDKSFEFASQQLGLGPSAEIGKLKTIQLPSVFNYRKQALVVIPRDFPSVRGNADMRFIEALADSLTQVALQTNGRMMVLFTSYKMLKQTYERMHAPLAAAGVTLLGQGMDSTSRSKLVRLFQEQSSTVLLGTSSFWEGVDIPGQALSCLAIVRLPFQPPNHPVVEAKNDALKRQNKNPFMKLSVPAAVIRFKQGFGRLVRTATDRGIVIVYDTRVIDTYYGKNFLYSLPGPKIEHLPTDLLVPRVRAWLEETAE